MTGSGSAPASGCAAATTDLGLGCVLGNLTTALGNVGTLPSDPTRELGTLVPSLTGVVTDVTGTLANLSSLLPIASLPLPAGGIPSLGLPAIPGLPALGSAGRACRARQWRHLAPGPPPALLVGRGRDHGRRRLPVRRRPRDRRSGSAGIAGDPVPGARPACPSTASAGGKASTPTGSASAKPTTGSTTTSTSTTTTTTTHGDGAAPVAAAAGEHPARLGGRRLRRRQHEWLGLGPDSVSP